MYCETEETNVSMPETERETDAQPEMRNRETCGAAHDKYHKSLSTAHRGRANAEYLYNGRVGTDSNQRVVWVHILQDTMRTARERDLGTYH